MRLLNSCSGRNTNTLHNIVDVELPVTNIATLGTTPTTLSLPFRSCGLQHAGTTTEERFQMRSKLLISTAALVAGIALASAQEMKGTGPSGGSAQSHPSPASPQANKGWDGLARAALAEAGVVDLL